MGPQLGRGVAHLEHGPAGEREIQHAAEGVDVRPRADRLAAYPLRRQVVRRPDDRPPRLPPVGSRSCLARPKSASIRMTARADEDVGGLDIAMHEPAPDGPPPARPRRRVDDARRTLRSSSGPSCLTIVARSSPSTNRIAENRRSPVLARTEDRHDVRVARATQTAAPRPRNARGTPASAACSGAITFNATTRSSPISIAPQTTPSLHGRSARRSDNRRRSIR